MSLDLMISAIFGMVGLGSGGVMFLYRNLTKEIEDIKALLMTIDKNLAVKSEKIEYLAGEIEEVRKLAKEKKR